MSASSVVVGIDVATAHADVAVSGAQFVARRFDNEATGGYEAALACALQAAGFDRRHGCAGRQEP